MSDVKPRPDSPGVWWREGWRVPVYVLWREDGCLAYHDMDGSIALCDFDWSYNPPEGRWLKADLQPPEFSQLPERPKLVLCRLGDERHQNCTFWFAINGASAICTGRIAAARLIDLDVIPHPDNDPEAVAAIEEANRNG